MATKTTKAKGTASSAGHGVSAETLNKIAAEIATRRRPMTLAELLELTEQ